VKYNNCYNGMGDDGPRDVRIIAKNCATKENIMKYTGRLHK